MRQYRQQMPLEQYFALDSENCKYYGARLGAFAGGAIINLLFAASGGAAGVVVVPAAGVFPGEVGAAAVEDGVLSGHAGGLDRMVRFAQHLKVGTREDLVAFL